METTEFLEESPGKKSNSRRIAWYAFWAGLVFAFMILMTGLYTYIVSPVDSRPDLLGIAGAASTMFAAIAGSAMAFTFFQKTQENKSPE